MKKHTVLIVDDQKINRKILGHLLEEEYNIIEACDGKEALDIMTEKAEDISAVLLDIVMPVMNGHEVLVKMHENKLLSLLPVIVSSQEDGDEAEMKALSLGAQDFIAKPYKGAIIKQRLENIINLRETAAIVNRTERDELTGLYNKQFFIEKAGEVLRLNPDKKYAVICFGVERFKLVNEAYGVKKGDELLKHIADVFADFGRNRAICGHFNGDWFYVLLPYTHQLTSQEFQPWFDKMNDFSIDMKVKFHCGVYIINDNSDPLLIICDRAKLASEKNRGKYESNFSLYDDSLRKEIMEEQFITNSMQKAINNKEFLVYYQPKYDLHTEAVVGAEALVRWISPERGFLSPGSFIPVFEKNGFITDLDRYVWERACSDLKDWMDRGIQPVPVSVNVSRADIFNPNLPEILTGLLEKYQIPIEYLHLEITESAYTDNQEQIISTVDKLHNMGFVIEMDDFGSGYSSLNMLAELPVDILKMDMGFVQSEEHSTSGRGIMNFVISMAKWMKLTVIAEGVETEEQITSLRTMDCNYVQGYYYSKPVPHDDFENIITTVILKVPEKEHKVEQAPVHVDTLNEDKPIMLIVDDIEINRDVLTSFFFDTYEIVEKTNGQEALDYLRGHYDQTEIVLLDLIMPVMDGFQMLKLKEREANIRDIPVIVTSQGDVKAETTALELGAEDFISKPYNPQVVEKRVTNVVGNYRANKARQSQLSDMRRKEKQLLDSIPGGVAIYHLKDNGKFATEYVSDGFAKLCGYKTDEFLEHMRDDARVILVDEDIPQLTVAAREAAATNSSISLFQHIYDKDGSVIVVGFDAYVMEDAELEDNDVALFYAVHTKVSSKNASVIEEQNRYRLILDNLDVAYFEANLDGSFYASDKYSLYELSKISVGELEACENKKDYVHEEDLPIMFNYFDLKRQQLSKISVILRLKMRDGTYRWTEMMGFFDYNGENEISKYIGVLADVDKEWLNQNRKIQSALEEAERANHAKTDFLARVSHDMRTPLNGILGLTTLIEKKTRDKEILDDVEKLKQSGEYLYNLINDTLDVSAVEHGKMMLNPIVCDGKTTFNNVINMVKPSMEMKQINFKMVVGDLPFSKLYMDVGRVQQAVLNILGNAVKFTPNGGEIEFTIQNLSVENGVITDKVVISDNGIGMSEEFQKHLFEPFAQENNDVKSIYRGTGLGLTIAKQCIELMGGSISVKSKVGKGTSVEIILPMPIATKGQAREAIARNEEERLKILSGKRVLLCEDHPLNAEIAIKLLRNKGVEVIHAENGEIGYSIFRSEPVNYFDAILMDIRMPKMDGLETTRAIRGLKRVDAKNVPIIALTANALRDDVKNSINAGMTEHLGKPVEPLKLYNTLASVIAKPNPYLGHKVLVVDDIEINRGFIKKAIKGMYEVLEAANGEEALEILASESGIAAVVTDIQMPVMDGVELIKKIREKREYDNIAILANTIYGDHKQEDELLRLGANDFVYKPTSPQVVLMRLSHIMRHL